MNLRAGCGYVAESWPSMHKIEKRESTLELVREEISSPRGRLLVP